MAETSPQGYRDTAYVAARAGVTAQQVRNWARRALIPVEIAVARSGRREYRFPAEDVDRWLDERAARRPLTGRSARPVELERRIAELEAALERERSGRMLAEQRIYALEQEVGKRTKAILALLADGADPSEALARLRTHDG